MVDGGHAQMLVTGVHETVGGPGRGDDDVSRQRFQLGGLEREGHLAGLDDEDLLVRVPMQLGASTRRSVHEDDRQAGTVVDTLELVVMQLARSITGHMRGYQSARVPAAAAASR